METRFLIPAPGRVVRSPGTGLPLPSEGADVEFNTYWQRRLNDGDVVEGRRPKTKTQSAE